MCHFMTGFFTWLKEEMAACSTGGSVAEFLSCLENPTDRGAWWASVHGSQKRHDIVTKKQLSKRFSDDMQAIVS